MKLPNLSLKQIFLRSLCLAIIDLRLTKRRLKVVGHEVSKMITGRKIVTLRTKVKRNPAN